MATPTLLRIRPPAFNEGKLDGTNYTLWKFKISAILDSYELLNTVLGLDPEPVGTPNPNNPNVITPPNADLLRAWKRRNADALCALVTSSVILFWLWFSIQTRQVRLGTYWEVSMKHGIRPEFKIWRICLLQRGGPMENQLRHSSHGSRIYVIKWRQLGLQRPMNSWPEGAFRSFHKSTMHWSWHSTCR